MHGPFAIHRGHELNTDTPVINCAWCGEETPKTNWRKKFCSKPCADKGKPGVQGTCCVCGDPMRRGKGSAPEGQARHNKCSVWSLNHTGHKWECRCETCLKAKSDMAVKYREWHKEKYGVNPSTPARRKRRQQGLYEYRDGIPGRIRGLVYERDHGVCQICGTPTTIDVGHNADMAPSLDHITPRSHGGTDDESNLRTVHRICNTLRSNDKRTDAEVKAIMTNQTMIA